MTPEEKNWMDALTKLRTSLEKSNAVLKQKTQEIDSRIASEQPKLFEDDSKLFEIQIDQNQRKTFLAPYKAEVLKLEQAIGKLEKQQITGTGSLF